MRNQLAGTNYRDRRARIPLAVSCRPGGALVIIPGGRPFPDLIDRTDPLRLFLGAARIAQRLGRGQSGFRRDEQVLAADQARPGRSAAGR